jgi:hypothetical protein
LDTGIRIKKDLKDGADGVLKNAVELLAVVASVTQNVPYLGIISGVLTEVIKAKGVRYHEPDQYDVLRIEQEAETCKDQWEIIILDVTEIKEVIEGYRKRLENKPESELPELARSAFTKLEEYVFSLSCSNLVSHRK